MLRAVLQALLQVGSRRQRDLALAVLPDPGETDNLEHMERWRAVEAFWRKEMVESEIAGIGGIALRCLSRPRPAGCGSLVIVGGRTEFAEKYAELLYDLRDSQLSLHVYDHRGQGLSGRLLADRRIGHVEAFADYVDDLETCIGQVAGSGRKGRLFLLGHSMGGTISILYACRRRQALDGLILASPMLAINTRLLPQWLVRAVCWMALLMGRGDRAVFGASRYHRQLVFAGNDVTGCRSRFVRNRQLVAANPHLEIGPPSYRWFSEALATMAEVKRLDLRSLPPVLLLQGEDERMVGTAQQQAFCARVADCRLLRLPGARHEVLMEEDVVRDRALAEIRDFLALQDS